MIFHAEKRNGFVMMDKAPLNDPRLSLKAKGLLAYLLSKPPDWRPQIADICKHCREGESAVRAALKELRSCGYASLLKDHGKDGRLNGSEWVIREKSQSPSFTQDRPIESRVSTEIEKNRVSVNRHPNKNDKTNNNEKPKGEVEVFYEEMRNCPPAGCTNPTPDQLRIENLNQLKLIGVNERSPFWSEWIRRSKSAPMRTICALSMVAEDIAWSRHKDPLLRGEKIRNPSGRADWYFQNIDLDSEMGLLKRGSRGVKHRKTINSHP